MSNNICNFDPIVNLSIRDLNRRLRFIHQYLCFLSSEGGGGAAADGISVNNSGEFVLGQDEGDLSNPAVFTANRQVPTAGFNLSFTNSPLVTDVSAGVVTVRTDDNAAMITINANGSGFINIVDGLTNSPTLQLNTDDSNQGVFFVNVGGVLHITHDLVFDLVVDVNNQEIMMSNAKVSIGNAIQPMAQLHIGASSGAPNTAPIKLEPGTFLGVTEVGAMEFDGNDLAFTRAGGGRELVVMASTITAETITPDTTITIELEGNAYKLVAQAL